MSTNDWADGRYSGRARPQISAKTTDTGLRLAVTLEILNEGYEGRTLTWFGNIGVSDKADDFAIRSLRDMGWSAQALDDPTGLGSVDVDVVVKNEMYKGKATLDVTVWAPRGDSFTFDQPADSGAIAAANARLKGKFAASVPKGPKAAPPPFRAPAPAGQPKHPADDNVPF